MFPERSMKIPELGSGAPARHSVMELPNGTFGNESSCQSLSVRLHINRCCFYGDSYLRYGGAAREGKGRDESGKWKGEGKARRGRGEGEMGEGGAEIGKGTDSGKGKGEVGRELGPKGERG